MFRQTPTKGVQQEFPAFLRSQGHRFLFFLLIFGSTTLFFLDIDLGLGDAAYLFSGFAHIAFFMIFALGLSRLPALSRWPFLSQFFLVMTAVLFVGGIIELAQPYFGRSASWRDLRLNLLGGFLGMTSLATGRHTLRRGLLVSAQFAAVALAVGAFYPPLLDMFSASHQFPVLSDFESRLEAGRWSNGTIYEGMARHGKRSLRVPLGTRKYAGTTLKRSLGDWRGYSTFAFSLYNPDPDPLPINVSIRDKEHARRGGEYSDRFNRAFTMEQGWNDIYVSVAGIESAPLSRTLDLGRLTEVVIFTVDLPSPRLMYLDHVHLIP